MRTPSSLHNCKRLATGWSMFSTLSDAKDCPKNSLASKARPSRIQHCQVTTSHRNLWQLWESVNGATSVEDVARRVEKDVHMGDLLLPSPCWQAGEHDSINQRISCSPACCSVSGSMSLRICALLLSNRRRPRLRLERKPERKLSTSTKSGGCCHR